MGGRIDSQNGGQYARDGSEDEKDKRNDIKTSMLVLSTLAWSVLSFGEIKNRGWEKEITFAKGLVSYLYLTSNSKSITRTSLSFLCYYYSNEDLNKQNLCQ